MTTDEKRAWLDGLKPGDEVAVQVHHYGPGADVSIACVSERTKRGRGRIMAGGWTFFADSGKLDSGPHTVGEIIPVTAEIRAAIKHRSNVSRLRNYSLWDKRSPALVAKVCAMLDEEKANG